MAQFKTPQAFDKSSSFEFYEQRYRQGYMTDWPDEKQKRIFNVIKDIQLPEIGEALDFGCGNGIFTEILRQALPIGWRVYGVDISSTAIKNARTLYPNCTFFDSDDNDFKGRKFDFIFTHHVLEHVYDLNETFSEIEDHLQERSHMLHVLPCGNSGSFEANVCSLRSDGVNPNIGNRFFFEDEGHVRRLTTDDLASLVKKNKFNLQAGYYSCQYFGAIDWITNTGPNFVSGFADQKFGVNEVSRRKLKQLRMLLLTLAVLRQHAETSKVALNSRPKIRWFLKLFPFPERVRSLLKLFFFFILFVFTKPFDFALTWLSQNEWNRKKLAKNGSEMYLAFSRAKS